MKPPPAYLRLLESFAACKQDAPVVHALGRLQRFRVIKAAEECLRCFPRETERLIASRIIGRKEKKPVFMCTAANPFYETAEREVSAAGLNCDAETLARVVSRLALLLSLQDLTKHEKYQEAHSFGVSRASLDRWSHAYRLAGVKGLVPGKSSGRPPSKI